MSWADLEKPFNGYLIKHIIKWVILVKLFVEMIGKREGLNYIFEEIDCQGYKCHMA